MPLKKVNQKTLLQMHLHLQQEVQKLLWIYQHPLERRKSLAIMITRSQVGMKRSWHK
uniref:Uncharacterized protein n=1 Tax=Arundo donax TaxID=35708 RepID=A0A0A9DWI6_ARUDO